MHRCSHEFDLKKVYNRILHIQVCLMKGGALPIINSFRYEFVLRGYYMATRRYQISLRVLQNISGMSAATE